MSTDPETTRVVRSWLMTDEHESATHVVEIALTEIETTPQRRSTQWPARRTPTMSKIVGFGLAAAAVVAVVFIGSQLIGSNPGGLGADPTPIATPVSSPEPSVAEPSPSADGNAEGPFAFTNGSVTGGVPITVTISAPGWYGDPSGAILVKNESPDPPDGAGMIAFGGELYVYGDPCQWSTTRPDAPATTVEELVAALGSQASRDASAPADITLDGYAGQSITLHVPDDADFGDCDQATFGSWAMGSDPTPSRFHQGPGQVDELWIVDVDGVIVVIDAASYEGTPATDVDELHAMVASVTFGE